MSRKTATDGLRAKYPRLLGATCIGADAVSATLPQFVQLN
jgi:hypothetical protein